MSSVQIVLVKGSVSQSYSHTSLERVYVCIWVRSKVSRTSGADNHIRDLIYATRFANPILGTDSTPDAAPIGTLGFVHPK